ncbi:ATPase, T2SS/T4P/T4SS family, partial [Planctomycetota bacterium]|nr:ATPase, T2SS/T4P/T4SS family [Planctomycetota bacterium]
RCEVSGLPLSLDYRIVDTPLGPSTALELEDEDARELAGLGQLGLGLDALAAFEATLAQGRGMFVVAAPRGGGKTGAYYAILDRAVRLGESVLSLERQVKRFVPGTTQLELDPNTAPIDSLLKPVPDWLGVDGPQSSATARLAADVVLAGRTVVLTVAAPDACSALLRLEMAGLPPQLSQRHVRAVLARRVVARNCSSCRVAREPHASSLARLGLPREILDELAPQIGIGCPACAETGRMGTVALAELVRPGPDGALAPFPGATPLAERARELVRAGDIPLEAVSDCLQ